jgi:TolB-like protein/DNA-binding winged helix-turn-helix (wHTH) protein/Tfp pilus assembly protein PilF
MNRQAKHFYTFGPFRFDPEERLLLRDGKPVPLAPKVMETLLLLVQNAGHLVDKDDLMKRVWPDAFVEEGNLNKNIFLLRKVLGQWDGGLEYIETVSKRGYRFAASVNQGTEAATSSPPQTAAGANEAITGARMRWLHTAMIGIALLLALAAFATLLPRWGRFGQGVTSDLHSIHSLAVLPLENLSGDPAQDYFADGMTDELITDLGQISTLRVISRTSVMQYKGVHKPLPQIAHELNVDAVVEGTVVRSGWQVRITAQLIQAAADKHLWAQSYQGDLKDLLALQYEVASAIAKQIRMTLAPHEHIRFGVEPPISPEAYELYLRGEYSLNRFTPDSIRQAATFFQQAIERDPNYPIAYTKLAGCYQILGNMGAIPKKVAYPKAKLLVAKALELDPQFAAAHAVEGWGLLLYELNFTAAGAEFRRAVELNPNGVEGHEGLGNYYATMGQLEESVQEMERARELDPLALIVNTDLCMVLYFARRYDGALAQCKANLDLDPNSFLVFRVIGAIYAAKGMDSDAALAFLQAHTLAGDPPVLIAALKRGERDSGVTGQWNALLQFYSEDIKSGKADPFDVATGYVYAGNTDKALTWLEKAMKARRYGITFLGVDPAFDRLRSDPRFVSLLRRMGLPQNATLN